VESINFEASHYVTITFLLLLPLSLRNPKSQNKTLSWYSHEELGKITWIFSQATWFLIRILTRYLPNVETDGSHWLSCSVTTLGLHSKGQLFVLIIFEMSLNEW